MNLANLFLTMVYTQTTDGGGTVKSAFEIGTKNGFCASTANVWQIVGYALLVFKIVIPLLLIIFGMIDLGKAVIASKEDEIKKATGSLVRRAIAAVIIFLLPTIVSFLVGVVGGFGDAENDYSICRTCLTNPGDDSGSGCATYADTAWKK